MGRLGVLIVLLAVVVAAAVVVQLRVAPLVALPSEASDAPKKLSKADQRKLEVLKTRFLAERDKLLEMRDANASESDVAAQRKKTETAAMAVSALGGTQVLKVMAKTNPPKKPGRDPSMMTPRARKTSMSGASAGSSCSGEAGGSCSGEGETCTPSSADKQAEKTPSKDAKAGAPAKSDAAAKPAAPTKP